MAWLVAGCVTTQSGLPLLSPRLPLPPGTIAHRVERGETLWRIAQRYHVSLETLVELNQLASSHQIQAGQSLWVPQATQRPTPPPSPVSEEGFVWPVRGEIIAYFGVVQAGSTNRGIDIHVRRGMPVQAARSGRAVFVDHTMPGYGQTVILDHGDGFSTVYAWNEELLVELGQTVAQGARIATAGSSGRATDAALHFEIRKHHVPHNPLHYLP